MKREFLEQLESDGVKLTKEIIDSIMSENGKDIEASKKELSAVIAERDGLKTQITDRDKDLEDLRKQAGNSEELNKQFADLQEKYNTETAGLKEQLSKQAREHAAEKFFDGIEFASDRIKSSIIEDFKKQDFKFNDETNTFQGGKEWLDTLIEKEPTSFKTTDNNTNQSGFRASTGAKHTGGGQPDYDSMSDEEYYAAIKASEKTQ